jgi:Ca2+:H+ antiporter
MYQSTPQHLVDEESHPGVLADFLNHTSSSSSDSSSSSSDTDTSSNSNTTTKRIKRAFRRKRRKSTSSAQENPPLPTFTRSSSVLTSNGGSMLTGAPRGELEPVFSGDEADNDGEGRRSRHYSRTQTVNSRDFETSNANDDGSEKSKRRHKKSRRFRKSKKDRKAEKGKAVEEKEPVIETVTKESSLSTADTLQPHVSFVPGTQEFHHDGTVKRPFNIRNISEAVRPAFSSANFPHHEATGKPLAIPIRPSPQPRLAPPSQIRRTSSMPEIPRPATSSNQLTPSHSAPQHNIVPLEVPTEVQAGDVAEAPEHLSRTSSIIALLITTGLVALCAEFLVGSIDYLIANSGISQAFVGLIILPIVGNAAEHVTAVTVAAKNKMDLAINIALGSSIQIALFITPLMVILGWIIKTDMSLYFSLFETVSLFASAFIVSFLMIDGRSNYLEGALLIAAYVIIAVSAYFYPTCDLSSASGPLDGSTAVC